ncbi:MAG: hypothetical protein GY860_24000 [Desulfobacteraceae bacterium]|nr:hypothetical protein [Desulfobacteraceae bacterium]
MNRRKFIKVGLGGILGAGLIGSYPVFIERYNFQLNHYVIQFENLPIQFNGYKILHLSDIHVGPFLSFRTFNKIIHKIKEISTDLIVLTGDYVHNISDFSKIKQIWDVIQTLEAKDGVLNVLGNHDHWQGGDYSIELLENSGQSLRNKTKTIEKNGAKIVFGGAGDLWEDHFDIDLTLSGHTHGGQVVLPFFGATVLPVKNYNYDYGIKKTEIGKLFISKGIGTTIYPVRFNCAPEFALIELKRT